MPTMPASEVGALLDVAAGESSEDDIVRRVGAQPRSCRLAVGIAAGVVAIAMVLGFAGRSSSESGDQVGDAIGLASMSAAVAQLCTDGWAFELLAEVEYVGQGSADLITSASGGFSLTISGEQQAPGFALLELRADTLSFGSVVVQVSANTTEELRAVRVEKSPGSVCLSYSTAVGPADDSRTQCTYRPAPLPSLGFQLAPPGVLQLGSSDVARVTGFVQMSGTIPASFVVKGPMYADLWRNESAWSAVTDSAKAALQHVTGEGSAMVRASGVANVLGSVYFQASVVAQEAPGMACQVEASIAKAIRDRTLGVQVAQRAQLANISVEAKVALAIVPAVPMLCRQVACRYSEHRDALMEAKCLGALCSMSCCEKAWGLGIMPAQKTPLNLLNLGLNETTGLAPVQPAAQLATPSSTTAPTLVPETKVDALLGGNGTLKEKLSSDRSVLSNSSYKAVGILFTDGVDFGMELTLSLQKNAWAQEQTLITSALGAVRLQALRDDGEGVGHLSFEGALLGGRSCAVRSGILHAGRLVAKEYTVRLSKDAEQCCIETTPIPDLGSGRKVCSPKAPGDGSFQLLPVVDIVGTTGMSGIEIKHLVQTSGSITLSFGVSGLSWEKLTTTCRCADRVKLALEEAIAFAAGSDVDPSQVSVALQRGAASGASLAAREAMQPPQAVARQAPPSSEEEQDCKIGQEKLKLLLNGSSIPGEGADGKQGLPEAGPPKSAEIMESLANALSGHRRLAGIGTNTITVQATIRGCGSSCAKACDSILSAMTDDLVLQRVALVTGDGPKGVASVAMLAMQDKSCPGNPSKCLFVTCPDFTVNSNPLKACYGATCLETCCSPVTCSHVTCGKGMVKKHSADPRQACANATDCAEQCCMQLCADYDCQSYGEGLCPRSDAAFATAVPSQAKETCCRHRQCCDAPTPWCISCRKCMDQKSFCRSLLWKWMPKTSATHRRLRRRLAADPGDDGKLLAELLPGATSREEVETDEAHAAEIVRNTLGHLREQQRRLSKTTAAGASVLRRLGPLDERMHLLEGLSERREEAITLLLANARISKLSRSGDGQEKTWGKAFDAAALHSTGADHGLIVGCGPHVEVPCAYERTAVFLHHRGCKAVPHSVNTVAVLTDTEHAVTCGSDAVCYVWKIRSGTAVQAYFPDDPDHRGSINTVTVMQDATFIMSAGQSKDSSTGGRAFIWDWINGVEKESLKCDDGYFLSSAEMPVWQTSALGCSDGYTYLWAWGEGDELKLPYYRRSKEEIVDAIEGRLEKFFTGNWNGWQRWALSNQIRNHGDFREWVKTMFPAMEMGDKFWEAVDKFYEHHSMGSVNGIAYLMACQRLVTASSDGKIRFWNSDSGDLLKCMGGRHQGSANAVAALPDKLQAVSGGDDGIGRLWDLEGGYQLLAMHYAGVSAPINAVAVFPGGDRVAFGHEDGFVRIWKLDQGTPLCSIGTGSPVRGLAINPSNPMGQIITANADGYAWVFTPTA